MLENNSLLLAPTTIDFERLEEPVTNCVVLIEIGVESCFLAADLMKVVSDAAGAAVNGRDVSTPLIVGITSDGLVRVRHQE